MGSERSSSRARSDEPPSPVNGLRLRPLPPCSGPAFPVCHEYFEVVYGPLLGPTSVLLARNLARHLEAAGGPVTVCPIEISLEVGLRASHHEPLGKSSHLAKAVDRLAHHRVVKHLGMGTLGVIVQVPPLADGALGGLPVSVRRTHERFVLEL